jgi:hypothetical protein
MGEPGCVMAHKSEPESPLNVALEVTNLVPPMSSTTRPCWCSYQDANFISVTLAVMDLCTLSRLMLLTRRVGVDTTCLLLTRHVVLGGGDIIILEADRDIVCCLTLQLPLEPHYVRLPLADNLSEVVTLAVTLPGVESLTALAATRSSLKEDLTGAWLNLGGGGGWTLATGEVTGKDDTDIVLAFLGGRLLLGSLAGTSLLRTGLFWPRLVGDSAGLKFYHRQKT